MKILKVGLNGFGRIGRAFTRIALTKKSFEIVAINTRKTQTSIMAYLLAFDSVYRKFGMEVKEEQNGISVNGKKILTLLNDKPENIPWDKYGVDVVVDATGAFTKKVDLEKHLKGSVKKVVLTAPAKDEEIPFVVLGVNDKTFDFKKETIISNASCTTNCVVPMLKVIQDHFKIRKGFFTTVHAYTATQNLIDGPNKDFRRARAAAVNLIPASSGASEAVELVLPALKGKIDGAAIRAPILTGSITDLTAEVEKKTTVEEVNAVFKKAAEKMKGILQYTEEPIVSSDIVGNSNSCIFDAGLTKVNQNMIKIFGWYDNEWGYSCRMIDIMCKMK